MSTPTPEGSKTRGRVKPLATVAAGCFVMIGFISACGQEIREVEVQGPEITVTATITAPPVTKTTTVTTTAEIEATPEPAPEPEPVADTVMYGFAGAAAGADTPPSAPEPAPAPAPAAAYYPNCAAARAAGAAPIYVGEPGYSRKLDRDGDGIACE